MANPSADSEAGTEKLLSNAGPPSAPTVPTIDARIRTHAPMTFHEFWKHQRASLMNMIELHRFG